MKKSLIAVLMLVFLLAITGTAFAGPFSDVPANHWSYGAVDKLVKAGIIEGSSTNVFNGERTITRYEMAMIVAKAMERSDKADAEQKAVISKLAAEFAVELNNLGVRVAKLEDKTAVKIAGDFQARYVTDSPGTAFKSYRLTGNDQYQARFRFYVMGDLNNHTSVFARINSGSKSFGYGALWAGGESVSNPTFNVDLAFVNIRNSLGFDNIRIGRQWADGPGYAFMVGNANQQDGLYLDKRLSRTVKWKGAGYATGTYDSTTSALASTTSNRVVTTALVFNPQKDLEYSMGYWWSNEPGWGSSVGSHSTLMTTVGSYKSNQGFVVGLNKDISSNVHVISEYGVTKLNGAANLATTPKAYCVQISNVHTPMFYPASFLVDAKKQAPGTYGWAIQYRSIEAGATAASQQPFITTSYSNSFYAPYDVYLKNDNQTTLEFVYQSVLEKNLMFTFECQDYKVKNLGLTNLTSKELDRTYKVQFTWSFN